MGLEGQDLPRQCTGQQRQAEDQATDDEDRDEYPCFWKQLLLSDRSHNGAALLGEPWTWATGVPLISRAVRRAQKHSTARSNPC
jgi:hypothetical protein